MAIWSQWYPDVLPHVPGCPNMLVQHEMRRAAQAFFERARCWRINQAPIAVPALAESVSSVPTDATLELVEVESAWYDGRQLNPTTLEKLASLALDNWRAQVGFPSDFLEEIPGVLTLYPKPQDAATTGLTLRMIVKPSDTSTGLPDPIAQRYREGIVAGTKARLMAYRDKPWTNMDLAVAFGTLFGQKADEAQTDSARGNVKARVRTRTRWC